MKIIKKKDVLLLTEKCLTTLTKGTLADLADGVGCHCADMAEDMLINSAKEMKGKEVVITLEIMNEEDKEW